MNRREKIWDSMYPLIVVLGCMLAASVIVLLIAELVTGVTDPVRLVEEKEELSACVAILTYLAVLIFQRRSFMVDEMRFGKDKCRFTVRQCVLTGLALTFAGHAYSILLDLSGVTEFFHYYEETGASLQGQNVLLLILMSVVIGPAAEEVTFRGMMYRRMRSHIGKPMAVLLSSLIFGLYHGNMVQFLYTMPVGILLALVYEKSGSLKLTIAVHMALNLWAILGESLYSLIFKGGKAGLLSGDLLYLVVDLVALTAIGAVFAATERTYRKKI